MKKISTLLSLLAIMALSLQELKAQEALAAGHIQLTYAGDGSEACSAPTPYFFTLQFYRDFATTSGGLPADFDVTVESENLNFSQTVTLDVKSNEGQVNQFCLNGNPVATEGAWYTNAQPFDLPRATDWIVSVIGDLRSPENNNIFPAQGYALKTTLNNDVPCGDVTLDGVTYKNPLPNSTIEFVREEPVASFCSGINKLYNYQLPISDPDNTTEAIDRFSYALGPVLTDEFASVTYESPFSSQIPFPSSSFIYLDQNGVFSFTPSARFASVVNFKITERKKFYQKLKRCEKQNGCPLPSDFTEYIDSSYVRVSTTFRDMRFIFDNNCNSRLPIFEGVEAREDPNSGQTVYDSRYNAQEDAYEFDCGVTEMIFNLSNPMFCSTLDKNDFRIALSYDSIDTVVTAIDAVVPTFCNRTDEFDQVTLYLHSAIGPGEYNLFFRYGDNDSTTILNRCEFDLPINTPWTKIYVNTNFTYDHPKTDYTYCDPADELPFAKAVLDGAGLRSPRAFFTWKRNPNDPTIDTDTIFAEETKAVKNPRGRFSRYEVWAPESQTPGGLVSQAVWRVGAGLDYSIYDPFTGDTISEKICYDTDIFTVTRYKNPPVEIPNYDLCPFDDWPVVNLDTMVTLHNAVPKEFLWKSFKEFPRSIPNKSTLEDTTKWDTTRAGYTSFGVPGALTDRYNFFAAEVPLLINGHICREKDTFIVVKENVQAQIGRDSTICPGKQYELRNEYDYLVPDSMYYQWYFNDVLVDNTTDTMMIDERGEYKIEVVKKTMMGTECVGLDSVFINVADSLAAPEVSCVEVTFENQKVQQKFVFNHVEGGDRYQVRDINPDGTEGEWGEKDGRGLPGLYHHTVGAQMRTQVRAMNTEVPEDAECRYGPVSNIAEACEVIIKPTNVFTPNGDGVNDFLSFDLLELYPGSKLQVFNRWGKLIYEDEDYYNDWDGEDYKAGTYFYVLDINDPSYGIFKGTFTIIRD